MIVYGDPSYPSSTSALVNGLRTRLALPPGAIGLDEARSILVHAGQLEQAVWDAVPADLPGLISWSREVTDAAAELFLSRWWATQSLADDFSDFGLIPPHRFASSPTPLAGEGSLAEVAGGQLRGEEDFAEPRLLTAEPQLPPDSASDLDVQNRFDAGPPWQVMPIARPKPLSSARGVGEEERRTGGEGQNRTRNSPYEDALRSSSVERLPFLLAAEIPDIPLQVKIPEGFAFYTLFPESYAVSTLRWASDVASCPSVLVVGIRSIGTSLSALVFATLKRCGFDSRRLTVRPTGHPFDRCVELPEDEIGSAEWAIVVDEGPGLSGSSMASVAEALLEKGFARDRIVFFPGHCGEPGAQAPERVREWWATTPRYVTPTERLRWNGLTLADALAAETQRLLASQVTQVEDLSGGRWREFVFASPDDWPAVCLPFERTKFLVKVSSGEALMWRFRGFAAIGGQTPSPALPLLQGEGDPALHPWVSSPIASVFGFVAAPWIEGEPLSARDVTTELVEELASYLVTVSGEPLSTHKGAETRKRLDGVLYWNLHETFGEKTAEAARKWANDLKLPSLPTAGDGRMAPYEWRRTPDGRMQKTNGYDHFLDHTAVGRQPLAWDVAGAIIEWELDEAQKEKLLCELQGKGIEISADVLTYYRLAYAAFRIGMCAMCSGVSDQEESKRLRREAERYRQNLSETLACLSSLGKSLEATQAP